MAKPSATSRSAGTGREASQPRRVHRRGEHAGAIVAAAHRLIARKGDFTTQELIKEAGVALKTFYRHFTSKDQLLVALIGDAIEANAAALEAQAEGITDAVARLELFVTAPLSLMEAGTVDLNPRFITSEHWRLHELYPDEVVTATKPFTDLVRKTLEAGRDAGVLEPRDPERDAWLITTMVMAVFHHYAFHPDDRARATAAQDVWAFCLTAVGGRPAPPRGNPLDVC
jgi:AcrR family transcriptional regulator